MSRYSAVLMSTLLLVGCQWQGDFPDSLLIDQNGRQWQFPSDLRGKIVIVSFIYTHCPDVCGMTLAKLLELRAQLEPDTAIIFATITLDPRRDGRDRLRHYASVWKIPTYRWMLLTGTLDQVENVHRAFGIIVRKSHSERLPDGSEVYFLDHTDATFLIDRNGIVRDRRQGSTLEPSQYAQLVKQYSTAQ